MPGEETGVKGVWVVCVRSELVPALVRVLPQPSPERVEHGGERAGPPRPGAAAAPGGPRRHLPGTARQRSPLSPAHLMHTAVHSRPCCYDS